MCTHTHTHTHTHILVIHTARVKPRWKLCLLTSVACASFLAWTLQLTRVGKIRANSAIFQPGYKRGQWHFIEHSPWNKCSTTVIWNIMACYFPLVVLSRALSQKSWLTAPDNKDHLEPLLSFKFHTRLLKFDSKTIAFQERKSSARNMLETGILLESQS